uniref:Uncharacterized protein n=1 Tax=Arundo donax TaxID=35708 RepID=A0A0A9HG93_ARUDO
MVRNCSPYSTTVREREFARRFCIRSQRAYMLFIKVT